MEPTDECFEHHHVFLEEQSKIAGANHEETQQQELNDVEIETPRQRRGHQKQDGDDTPPLPPSSLVHSVLLADGIHHHVATEELIADIPDRFEKGSTKAKATWFGALCVAGIGMFVEAFVIITTGQIKTIWKDEFPECWAPDHEQACPDKIRCCGLFPNTPTFDNGTCAVEPVEGYDFCDADTGEYPDHVLCNPAVTGSISYSEFAGIMAGMIVFGAICDTIGRKNAGMLTSIIMIIGIGGMTYFDSTTSTQTIFAVFSMFFGLFGFGVGGEYPLTASGAAEHHAMATAHAEMDDSAQRRHRVLVETAKTARRGETIVMVFAMQGVGAVFGSAILQSLIFFSHQQRIDCNDTSPTNSSGVDPSSLSAVWRSFYMLGLVFVIMLLLYRYLVLEEGDGHAKLQERKKRRERKVGKGRVGTFRLFRFYSLRLIGTGGCWFLADVVFYGTKLFSGPIFDSINPSGDLISTNGWLLINNIIGMFGYYGASMLVDNKRIGRRNLQLCTFIMIVAVFFICAAVFDTAPSGVIMFLFFLSNFLINLGPNSTSYLMAAESYPTELRGTMHGSSAFMGKAGALVATIVFDGLSTTAIFWLCGIVGVLGAVCTFLFSVDMTRVSLAEHDAQLELFLEGRLDEYKGKLNAPEHLSTFERWTGMHGVYDPQWAAKLVEAEKSKNSAQQKLRTNSLGVGE